MTNRPKILALILAGGQGGRLDVLTERRAKPAVAFGGMYRLIDFALSNCMHSGLSDVWVVEQYRPHGLNEHLSNGRPWDLDRTSGGLQVLPPYETRDEGDAAAGFAAGNADALYQNRDFVRAFAPDVLLILSADHVYKLDFRDVIDAHLAKGAEVTMVTTEVGRAQASRFGVVQVTGGPSGHVTGFEYKPDAPKSGTVTTEVFVYDTAVLLDTLGTLAARSGAENGASGLKDFGHALLPHLVDRGKAWAFPFDGYWRDVGTPDSYWQAHQDLLALPEPPLVLDDPAWPLRTHAAVPRAPARVFAPARIDNSLVAPGCVVRGHVVRSVLGPGVVIEAGATIRDSVLGQDVTIAAGATIDHAVLDERVRVGEKAVVGRKTPRPPVAPVAAEDLTLVGRGVPVPGGAHVRPGSRLSPT